MFNIMYIENEESSMKILESMEEVDSFIDEYKKDVKDSFGCEVGVHRTNNNFILIREK